MQKEQLLPSDLLKQFPILENHSMLQTIKCKEGNHGVYICFENQCQNYPFMCNSKTFDCRKDHAKCIKTEVEEFIQKLQQKVVNLTKLVAYHNQTVDNFVQKIIKQTNQIKALFRDQASKKWKNLSFSAQELDILQKIQQNNLDNVKGADFFKVYHEMKLKKKDYSCFSQINQIEQIALRWKNIQQKVLNQFIYIKDSWTQNKNQRHLYTQNQLTKSQIATTVKQYQIFRDFFNKRLRFQLLYKASQNEFKVARFHKLCDGIPNTLVLILTQFDKKIGGFTPLQWIASRNFQCLADTSMQTFIFSLTHNEKLIQKDQTSGIANGWNHGPSFRNQVNGSELYVEQDAHLNQRSQGGFGKSFVHPNYQQQNYKSNERFTDLEQNNGKYGGQYSSNKNQIYESQSYDNAKHDHLLNQNADFDIQKQIT